MTRQISAIDGPISSTNDIAAISDARQNPSGPDRNPMLFDQLSAYIPFV